MKLEWEDVPGHGCLWIGRADGCRYLATSGEEKLKIQGEHNAYIEQIAAANGYVKAEVPITSMHDPRLTAKKTEPWHIDIDSLARSAGYVKLEPGQVVVDGEKLLYVLHNSKYPVLDDGTCTIDAAEELLRAIKEARDE